MRSKFCFFREVLQCLWGHLFNLFCPQADQILKNKDHKSKGQLLSSGNPDTKLKNALKAKVWDSGLKYYSRHVIYTLIIFIPISLLSILLSYNVQYVNDKQ